MLGTNQVIRKNCSIVQRQRWRPVRKFGEEKEPQENLLDSNNGAAQTVNQNPRQSQECVRAKQKETEKIENRSADGGSRHPEDASGGGNQEDASGL